MTVSKERGFLTKPLVLPVVLKEIVRDTPNFVGKIPTVFKEIIGENTDCCVLIVGKSVAYPMVRNRSENVFSPTVVQNPWKPPFPVPDGATAWIFIVRPLRKPFSVIFFVLFQTILATEKSQILL